MASKTKTNLKEATRLLRRACKPKCFHIDLLDTDIEEFLARMDEDENKKLYVASEWTKKRSAQVANELCEERVEHAEYRVVRLYENDLRDMLAHIEHLQNERDLTEGGFDSAIEEVGRLRKKVAKQAATLLKWENAVEVCNGVVTKAVAERGEAVGLLRTSMQYHDYSIIMRNSPMHLRMNKFLARMDKEKLKDGMV